MILKDTGISLKLFADVFNTNPDKSVRFQFFDENDQPIPVIYSVEGLCLLGDERIAALKIIMDCIKALIDNVVETRNGQIKQLANELTSMIGEPVKYEDIPKISTTPTGMCGYSPPENTE